MASRDDIQGLVNQLQQIILASKNAPTQAEQARWQHAWGVIKDKIGQYTGLSSAKDRMRLGYLMHARLDGLGHEASEPPPIIVEKEEKKILANPRAWTTPPKDFFRFPY